MIGIEASLSRCSRDEWLYTRANTTSAKPENTLPYKHTHISDHVKASVNCVYIVFTMCVNSNLAVSVVLSLTPRWISWGVRKHGWPPNRENPKREREIEREKLSMCQIFCSVPVPILSFCSETALINLSPFTGSNFEWHLFQWTCGS